MKSTRRWLTVLAVVALTGTPMSGAPMLRGITGIKSAPGLSCPCPLSAQPKIRRGQSNAVVLSGTGVAEAGIVVVSGMLGRVTNKNASEVTITLTPAADADLVPRVVSIMAGPSNLGAFSVQVVRRGLVSSWSPESIAGGRLTAVTVKGTDIKTAALREGNKDNRKVVSSSDTEVRLELQPTETQSQMVIDLGDSLTGGTFLAWRKFEIRVLATVATGTVGCQPFDSTYGSAPSSPSDKFLFDPLTGSQTLRRIEFKWNYPNASIAPSPDQTHNLEYKLTTASTWTKKQVEGLTYTVDLPKGTYEWKVTNLNCSTSSKVGGPWTFTIQ